MCRCPELIEINYAVTWCLISATSVGTIAGSRWTYVPLDLHTRRYVLRYVMLHRIGRSVVGTGYRAAD